MKTIIKAITFSAALFTLAGCASPEQQAADREAKQAELARITQCDVQARNTEDGATKSSFISLLEKEARSASADAFIADQKHQQLMLTGYDGSASSAINDCLVQQRKARLDRIEPVFSKRKAAAKSGEEKKALIEAYSAWEAYLKALSPSAKQEFDNKLAFYKNM